LEIDVRWQLQAMYDVGANHGFLIRDANENADAEQQFHSREKGSEPPQLVVTFGPPDKTPPETTVDSGPDGAIVSTNATFTFSANQQYSTFECSLDGAAFTACSSPRQYSGLTAGEHELRVRATDPAGNVDATPASRRWTVEAPDTTIDAGPPATTLDTVASFRFSSNDSSATFECSLNGAAFAACSSPKQYSGLALGDYEFRVRAKDAAGNVDASPASHTWKIVPDTTAPETTLGSGAPAATTTSPNATFTFSGSDNVTSAGQLTFECSLDGADYASCLSPKDYTDLALGAHSFRVRAKDAAGNADSSPASYFWTIEAPPVSSCVASTQTAAADRDAWVLQSSPTNNYGNDSGLKVDSKSGGNARALVRFALPEIPTGCVLKSATLRLYSASFKEGRTLQVNRLLSVWNETGVNWGSQPASNGTSVFAQSRSTAGYVEWTVTSHVQSMYTGTNAGFLIRDANEDGPGMDQSFNSREKGQDNPPQLVINFG
jgi:large repetitive protein